MPKPIPNSDDRMVRIDGEHPRVRFDAEKRANYHLDDRGEPVYHGVPAGYEFDETGALRPVKGD